MFIIVYRTSGNNVPQKEQTVNIVREGQVGGEAGSWGGAYINTLSMCQAPYHHAKKKNLYKERNLNEILRCFNYINLYLLIYTIKTILKVDISPKIVGAGMV